MITITVNGTAHDVDVEDNMPLLWVLRDVLNMTGTKYGCGIGACGACSVIVDGAAIRSCQVPASRAAGKSLTTIEGLKQGDAIDKVQAAWIAEQAPQCGYCQPGQIMAARALLNAKPQPTDADIDEAMTNICRCGAYAQMRAAIHAASKG